MSGVVTEWASAVLSAAVFDLLAGCHKAMQPRPEFRTRASSCAFGFKVGKWLQSLGDEGLCLAGNAAVAFTAVPEEALLSEGSTVLVSSLGHIRGCQLDAKPKP